MEVDGDRITDDERMDEDLEHQAGALLDVDGDGDGGGEEDYPVGEGDGMMEDSDGDEMMGDEIQDDQEYEVAMDEENIEPTIKPDTGGGITQGDGEEVESEPAPLIETPAIPFGSSNNTSDSSTPQPTISPFPETASSSTQTVLPRPLESPAPETEMTPVEEEEEQPFINDINGDGEGENEGVSGGEGKAEDSDPLSVTADVSSSIGVEDKVRSPSHEPQKVATTEEALDVLSSHPQPQISSEMAVQIPTVPGPQSSTLQVGESSKRAKSREPTPNTASHEDGEQEQDEPIGEGEEVDAEGEEDDEQEEEEYDIDANSLPPIIIHLPNDQARYLFETYENDPDTLPVWLKDRQAELAEASLADVWQAIRLECQKEGLDKNGALIIGEKQMDLKMNEDDVNLQSITFLELILLHHGCGLPEPVQLYLSWEESRFITRFNAIQAELDAVRERSESVHAEEEKTETAVVPAEEKKAEGGGVNNAEQSDPDAKRPLDDEPEQKQEEEYEEYEEDEYVEEEEIKSQQGAYSEVEEKYDQGKDRRRDQRDVKAQYAESDDNEVNTRDLERAHPNWAAARQKPTDALHFEGPSGKRYLNHAAEGRHQPDTDAKTPKEANDENDTYEGAVEYDVEEREDEPELEEGQAQRWSDDGGDTVDDPSDTPSKGTDTQDQDNMNVNNDTNTTVPLPLPVPLDEVEMHRQRLAAGAIDKLQDLRHAGLGENRATESPTTIDGSALPTPYASAAPTQIGESTQDKDTVQGFTADTLDIPADEIELKHQRESGIVSTSDTIPASGGGISTPAISSLTPSELGEAREIAREVAKQHVDAIPEEDEAFSEFVERLNEDEDAGQLEVPGGGNAIAISPVISTVDDGYTEEVYDESVSHDTQLGIGKGRDTVPVTPLEIAPGSVVEEYFEDETYESEGEGTLQDENEDDPTYMPQLEAGSTETETEGNDTFSINPTESTDVPSTTSVSVSDMRSPLSGKRFMEDEDLSSFDVDSKRAKTDTATD